MANTKKEATKKVAPKKAVTKPTVKTTKVAAKPVSTKTVKVASVAEKKVTTKTANLSIPVYSLAGRESGQMSLPKEIFGGKVNKALLSQAVRVYATNSKQLLGKTKTRGEVKASSVKIYRQKGTGRARHGAISAPIFVGGGIVFGPTPRKVRLDLPKGMKKAALISALSAKAEGKNIVGLTGLEKASGKTKEMAQVLKKIDSKSSSLIVTDKKLDNVVRGVNNIPSVKVVPVNLLNAYEVLRHNTLILTKEAVVLYFYPEDDTPGCIKEACSFRDNFKKLQDLGVIVLGVSADTISSHKKFAEKYSLNFPLLSDTEKQVINDYKAWGKKQMYGKEFEGILRTTYLINPKGEITKVYEKVDPLNHAELILSDLQTLR